MGEARKKKLLLEMKKEVEDLERQIKYTKLVNLKNALIRETLINGRRLQWLAPFILTACITAGGAKLIGAGFPFYMDDIEKFLYTKKEFDNTGNIRYEEQYGEFNSLTHQINHYTKWEDAGNGFYTRRVESYKLSDITDEKVLSLFEKDNLTISDIFGNKVSSVKETKNNLTEEELMQEEYLEATIYKKDEDDYIIVKESIDDNIGYTAIYVLVTILAEIIPLFYRLESSKFDYDDAVYKIREKYSKVDVEKVKKLLEIKRDNYNRLVK